MQLSQKQIERLKELMGHSAQKGNLANSGMVLENENAVADAESLVVSNHDATAHSERMLVELVCKMKNTNYTPGLVMVTVCEPCLMCLSACAWAGYKEIAYIIPASKYIEKIPWMSEAPKLDREQIASSFSSPIKLTHLKKLENEFSEIFEEQMKELLK